MHNLSQSVDLPVVVLRNMTLFPGRTQPLDVVRQVSMAAIRKAADSDKLVFVTMQRDPIIDEPQIEDLHRTGVVAVVSGAGKSSTAAGVMRVTLRCKYRAKATNIYVDDNGVVRADVIEAPQLSDDNSIDEQIMMKALVQAVRRFAACIGQKELLNAFNICTAFNNLTSLVNFIVPLLPISGNKKQELLEIDNMEECAASLVSTLYTESELAELVKEVESEVKSNIDQSQREYYLREQLKVITSKLGDDDSPVQEAEEYREKIAGLDMPETSRELLLKTCSKLAKLPSGSHEAAVERNYIDACLALPWGIYTEDQLNVSAAQKKLDADHYGMEKVKERILEFIAVRALAPDIKGQIICLAGPPGVGKTSIAHSVAEALGRKYCRVSLGGVHDEADIRGHRKTYIGAMPGRIANALKLAGTNNPLILLDEVDKLASDFRGDPTSALLEVLDPEQNVAFHDHYIELPIDLSSVMFITTANDINRIPAPLLDRMEIIELPSYTLDEKRNIAKRHLIKKQLSRHGLNGNQLRFTDKAVCALIHDYTRESGVRNLEREIASLCRKAAKKIAMGSDARITITDKLLPEYLGPAKFARDTVSKCSEVGVVNGLAWTSVGGTMLEIEAVVLDGTGKIELTGSLGDVMKESAKAAISYIRSRAERFGIEPTFYKDKDIHIHAPEGATPKDGPSAGVTMTTAIVSALTGIPVRSDVAMTGEVTLRGRVLQIGGLREKSMAAYTAGIHTVIIPEANQADIAQLSEVVRSSITFITASHVDTVLENALEYMPTADNVGINADATAHIPLVAEIGGTHEAGESRI